MDEEVVWFLYMLMGPLTLPEFIQTPNGIILKVDLPLRVLYTTCIVGDTKSKVLGELLLKTLSISISHVL